MYNTAVWDFRSCQQALRGPNVSSTVLYQLYQKDTTIMADKDANFIILTSEMYPGGGGNSLYFVWYRRAAGIAPIFQVIYTSIGHDFISDIHL